MVMKKTNEGVSPVVGIMLMLVVTLIIAAVVSFTAFGFLDTAQAADSDPQVEFVGLYTGGYGLGDTISGKVYSETGMVFMVTGTSPLDITNLQLSGSTGNSAAQSSGGSFVVSYNTPVTLRWITTENGGTAGNGANNRLTQPAHMVGHRIAKFGEGWSDEEKFNTLVYPGEMFVIAAEYTMMMTLSGKRVYMIGFAADAVDGTTVISGAIYSDGNTELALKNMQTGKVYYTGILTNDHAF